MRWYVCAVTQGSAVGQNYLGYCYGVGLGVDQNDMEAFRYYDVCAKTEANQQER